MPSTIPILRNRRERRLARQHLREGRIRNAFLVVGMFLSLAIAASIVVKAFAYISLTRALPSVEMLPALLNPPEGLLLQPRASTIALDRIFCLPFPPMTPPVVTSR